MSFTDGIVPEGANAPEGTQEITPQAAPEGGAPEGQPQVDPTMERFDRMEQAIADLVARTPAPAPAAPAPVEEPAPDYTAEDLLRELGDENFNEDGVLTADGVMAFNRLQVQRELAARDAREGAARAQERRTAGLEALERRYPDLGTNMEVQTAVVNRVKRLAQSIAAGTGADPDVVAQEPELVEQVYISLYGNGSGGSGGQPETPTTPVPVTRPGGASVATTDTKDRGDRLVELAQGGHTLL